MLRCVIVGILVCCLSAVPVVSTGAGYEAVYLGALAGGQSWALGVNGKRAVVGCSTDANGHQRAFLWTQEGGIVDLGTLGGDNAAALGVNDDGEIVGYADTAEGARRAFLRTVETEMVDLGVLPEDTASEGTAVADFVVGWSRADAGGVHAFSWNVDTGLTRLAELEPGADTQALGINSQGVAVGWARDSDGNVRAVCWRPDGTISMQDTGTLGGAKSSAHGINRAGLIVGEATDDLQQVHAFCWIPDSGLHQLPIPRGMTGVRATSVNDANQIAGYTVGKRKTAIVWDLGPDLTGEVTIRVNVLPLLEGTVESEAMAINNDGVVVGSCVTPRGERRAVLWRPVKKRVAASFALVGGLFVPIDASTRDRFAKIWLRAALKPFEREKRTYPHFSAEGGALTFDGPTDVQLYELSFGIEKGLEPYGFVQPYLAIRGGPYWGRMEDSTTGARDRNVGLNLNASYGVIFRRNVYAELRYDFFSRFAGVDLSGLSFSVGFRLFDLRR